MDEFDASCTVPWTRLAGRAHPLIGERDECDPGQLP